MFFMAVTGIAATALQGKKARRCDITNENFKKTKEVHFQAFLDYDPGENLMLDPAQCKFSEISCENEGRDSIVTYPMTCKLLHSAPKTPKDKTPTGQNHSFEIKIRVTPEGKMTVIK